ncbi:Quasimodo 3 [Cocos nucifera]|uniref:Methyltransferase n=1 Tax=Cocos nucifera TaxID=13894 RepID=A0A8K0IFN4_COCNU|nr:Quasimodo 3 [Cocos nucifera]
MGHVNLPPSRRGGLGRQWTLLDLVSASFFAAVLVFFVLVFTSLGDSLAASGRRALARSSSSSDPRQRDRLIALLDGPPASGGHCAVIDACAAEEVDYMPCEDPRRNSQLSRHMNLYRERHCPPPGESLLCLIPPPQGYRYPVPWPESLHKIWHDNMPYDKIAERKGHQGWMKEEGQYFIFPGGGTMFPDGAAQYITKLGQFIRINSGLLRTALDMGCGVASFGGFLLKENIMTLSFAPRDSHKSQIQFALERGIPAFVAMLGTHRLPFPASSFDLDKEWGDLQAMAHALCYELITVDGNTAIWKKPSGASCLPNQNEFGLDICSDTDDPSEAWYFKLKKCVSKPSLVGEIAVGSIPRWPDRLSKPTARVSLMKNGVDVFEADTRRWVRRVAYYKKSLGLELGKPRIRNVMDMNAIFGGFAAALNSDPVWVMNVIPARKPLTLGIIYDRGLIGVYHDWCHLVDIMIEMDRILRPEGTAVIRDSPEVIDKVTRIAHAIRWTAQVHESEPETRGGEKILVATKTLWKLPPASN